MNVKAPGIVGRDSRDKCFIINVVSSFAEVGRKQIITLKINK